MSTYDISQAQAARIIKKSVRTTARYAERGELDRCPTTGKYSRENCEEWLELHEEEQESSSEKAVVSELTEGYGQAVRHVERMVQLLEGPMNSALQTVTKINENLLNRLSRQEDASIEMMKVVGDQLLQKEERQALREEAQARAETLRRTGAAIAKHIPELMKQVGGKSALNNFTSKLSESDKEGIAGLYHYFDDEEKKQAFADMMQALGMTIPPKPEETVDVSDEGAVSDE